MLIVVPFVHCKGVEFLKVCFIPLLYGELVLKLMLLQNLSGLPSIWNSQRWH